MPKRSVIFHWRRTVVAVASLLAFCALLLLNPNAYQTRDLAPAVDSETVAYRPEQTSADSTLARDVLESLAVKDKATGDKYYRKLFYDNWSTTENGCNMREAILARDLTEIVLSGCKVVSGTLRDPYTGKTINFMRGQETSSAVQIDHVVALSNAWSTGAFALDQTTRYQMSQDPLNLIAVDGPANQQKSDQDAAEWLPSNIAFRCQYVARQISVKYKYRLWVTRAEKAAMLNVLADCPDEPTLGLSGE